MSTTVSLLNHINIHLDTHLYLLPQRIEVDDPTWGVIKIQKWSQFHFYHSADYPMEVILIHRQSKSLSQREVKPMWLAWIGYEQLSLIDFWKLYLRRFAIEHLNRFIKQRLHWTKAKLGTTEKGQRWSDLMPILTWQLWLTRDIIEDNPLPWRNCDNHCESENKGHQTTVRWRINPIGFNSGFKKEPVKLRRGKIATEFPPVGFSIVVHGLIAVVYFLCCFDRLNC